MGEPDWEATPDLTLAGDDLARGRLRSATRHLPNLAGVSHEILDGTVVLTPGRSQPHEQLVDDLRGVLAPQISTAKRPAEARRHVSVTASDPADEDFTRPDLVFCEAAVNGGSSVPAERVVVVCEVVTPGRAALIDIVLKSRLYARWGIPFYLIADPREATLTLRSMPDPDHYRTTLQRSFTGVLPFPAPLAGVELQLVAPSAPGAAAAS